MSPSPSSSDFCNCTGNGDRPGLRNATACLLAFRAVMRQANIQMWITHKHTDSYRTGSDIYTVIILGLMATIITVLMVRIMGPSESVDEQVDSLTRYFV